MEWPEDYHPGDCLQAKMKSYTTDKLEIYTGTVEQVTKRFIVLHTGRYRVTVLLPAVHCGEAKVERIQKAPPPKRPRTLLWRALEIKEI